MPQRRSPSVHRYTTVYVKRDGVRVPFVRLSGRWLEAFGFKEGAKFAAFGEEAGRIVLTVIAQPRGVQASACDGLRTHKAQHRLLRRRRGSLAARRFRFYLVSGRFHPTAARMKAIARRLLLVWRTVNPIARRLSLAPGTVPLHR